MYHIGCKGFNFYCSHFLLCSLIFITNNESKVIKYLEGAYFEPLQFYHGHKKLQEHELNQGHNKENKSQEM